MAESIKAEDFDPPLTGKQVEQVQEVINEALRRQLAEQPVAEPKSKVITLADYKLGEQVEVFSPKAGDFIKGFIQTRDKGSGHLHVHTDRGPVTVATVNYIRKLT